MPPKMDDKAWHQIFGELRLKYANLLPEKIEALDKAWEEARETNFPPGKLLVLEKLIHGFGGAGTSYGFADISATAQEAEGYIEPFARSQSTWTEATEKELKRRMDRLEDSMRAGMKEFDIKPAA